MNDKSWILQAFLYQKSVSPMKTAGGLQVVGSVKAQMKAEQINLLRF